MIKQFEKLTMEERALLFKAPVLVSVLASCSYNAVNKIQKADAIKLAHLKTFTAIPLLIPYYTVVEKYFKEQFETLLKQYFPFDEAKRMALKKEIDRVHLVIGKLDKEYAKALGKSLEKYANHVKRSTHTVFVDFIFPVPIPGLSN
ncbi:MAG: hypothetical protein ABIR15_05945 [Chitinophagaceae bacterium]